MYTVRNHCYKKCKGKDYKRRYSKVLGISHGYSGEKHAHMHKHTQTCGYSCLLHVSVV